MQTIEADLQNTNHQVKTAPRIGSERMCAINTNTVAKLNKLHSVLQRRRLRRYKYVSLTCTDYQYYCPPWIIIVILESNLTFVTHKPLRCKQVLTFCIPFSTNTDEDSGVPQNYWESRIPPLQISTLIISLRSQTLLWAQFSCSLLCRHTLPLVSTEDKSPSFVFEVPWLRDYPQVWHILLWMTKASNLSPSAPLPNMLFAYRDGAPPCILCSMPKTTLTQCAGIIWACLNNLILNRVDRGAEKKIHRHTFSSWKLETILQDPGCSSLAWYMILIPFRFWSQITKQSPSKNHVSVLTNYNTWGRTGTRVSKIIPILLFRVLAPKLNYLSLFLYLLDARIGLK